MVAINNDTLGPVGQVRLENLVSIPCFPFMELISVHRPWRGANAQRITSNYLSNTCTRMQKYTVVAKMRTDRDHEDPWGNPSNAELIGYQLGLREGAPEKGT